MTTPDYFEIVEDARLVVFDFSTPDEKVVERAARFGATYSVDEVAAARIDAEARHAAASAAAPTRRVVIRFD